MELVFLYLAINEIIFIPNVSLFRYFHPLILLLISLCAIGSCDDPPGHMLPLGSHMPPLHVEETERFPNPITFYEEHVAKNKPLIMRGLIKEMEAFQNWRYDSYLRFDTPLPPSLPPSLPFTIYTVLHIALA